MKKQMRKAMLSTLCLLIVGIMSLTGVTYAWFSTGTQATVNSFDVNVEAAAGAILIATTPASGDKLSFTGSVTVNNDEYNGKNLTPVSTTDPTGKFYTATLSADGTKITSDEVTTNISGTTAHWIEFDLYFYNPSDTTLPVYVDGGTTVGLVSGQTGTEGSFLATRVAYTAFTPVNFASNGDITTSHSTVGATYIFEPNAKIHTAAGVNAGATQNSKATYKGVKAEATDIVLATDTASLAAVTTYEIGDATAILSLGAKQVGKVTVRIWIEGQDVDCLNDIAGKPFASNLKFTSTAPTAGN